MRVLYYVDCRGNNPVKEFIDSLSVAQQRKVLRAIQPVIEFGIGSHLRNTKKLVGTPLWEIRVLGKDNIRMFYAIEIKGIVLILNGFIKKSQKTPNKEIQLAMNRLEDAKLRLTS